MASTAIGPNRDIRNDYKTPDRILTLSVEGLANPTSKGVLLDSNFGFSVISCLIYSEKVTLADIPHIGVKKRSDGTYQEPELGIFCSFLIIESQSGATIDVRGDKGADAGGTNTAQNGGTGGKIWLYVENMDEDIVDHLRLIADGGDGGVGCNIVPGGDAGMLAGGNGGNAGQISVYYGCQARTLKSTLTQMLKPQTPWPKQVQQALSKLFPADNPSPLSGIPKRFSPEFIQECKQTCTNFGNFAAALGSLVQALNQVINKPSAFHPKPTMPNQKSASSCQVALQQLLSLYNPPQNVAQADIDRCKAACGLISEWFTNGGADREAKMATAINDCTQMATSQVAAKSGSAMWDCFKNIGDALDASLNAIQSGLQNRVCSVEGGKGGVQGLTTGGKFGNKGSNGQPGTITAKCLNFDGQEEDLKVDIVTAFPDQCQMLSNQGDAFYFSGDVGNAREVYSRLTKRLAFVPTLNTSDLKSPLAKAYQQARDDWKLIISPDKKPVAQLGSLLNQTTTKLNRIGLNQDIFGHAPNWVPRLAFWLYFNTLNSMLIILEKQTTTLKRYEDALRTNAKEIEKEIAQSIANADGLAAAKVQIDQLTNSSGIMQGYVAKIRAAKPKLEQKHDKITAQMDKVKDDIQNKLNFNPQDIVEGFASFCMMPSKLSAIGQVAAEGYKAFSTVHNTEGYDVEKDCVIDQLTALQNATLESFNQCIADPTVGPDGSITPPDQTAILAAKEDINKVINDFKSAIPKSDRDALSTALDEYMQTVLDRNDAMLRYTAALQLLGDASSSEDFYKSQQEREGDEVIENAANQGLPLIYTWMKKAINDYSFAVMQSLDYAARAGSFWGLMKISSTAELDDALKSGVPTLDCLKTARDHIWNVCYDRMASFTKFRPSVWPPDDHGRGAFEPLNAAELDTLKRGIVEVDSITKEESKTYGVYLTLDPKRLHQLFAGKSLVRLHQVRFWALGATVSQNAIGQHLIQVELKHMGREQFCDENGTWFDFDHEIVVVKFAYDSTAVKTIDDCTPAAAQAKENMTGDFTGAEPVITESGEIVRDAPSAAAVGPFTTWMVQLKESSNPGLNMEKVTKACIEFCYTYR
ncbi:uncharacterized protein BDR25DRAFT_251807 [Lindgomyces ingoldianus]|uniref:Uncharacterized protein n=1 Tax=Lindgomyces ingoldianus TaxID=673940 RepID=A0ACB6RFF8_9PLEO|nr:uncharacterized protein BDR25DRAFT_251807 [Lindgomyces ingoldianus]KAF2477201.1 hypothetical protein BDR25DRAFT_251807 [Lindgomyces ingoldianus]